MTLYLLSTPTRALATSLVGGSVLVAAALTLMPSGSDIKAAVSRASWGGSAPAAPALAVPGRTPEVLARMFARGAELTVPELKWLLASSTKSADAATLTAMARKIEAHEPVSTRQVTWDIMAGNRPEVAQAFIEQQGDRNAPENWQLRFDLNRKTGHEAIARGMVQEAALRPSGTPAAQLIAAAYAVNMPEAIVVAAENRAIPRLDAGLSLDLARRAVAMGRPDLLGRIDRVGTPTWRTADPWLALTLARQAGDYATALRYAAMLPSGRDETRRALILESGDRAGIRAMLLDQAGTAGANRGSIAQDLLQQGFRPDAIRVLQAECADRGAADPMSARLIYLMGPRPDQAGLQWLRQKAQRQPDWQPVYLEREQPAVALAFLRNAPDAGTTHGLLQRLRLANAAKDRAAGVQLVAQLLDGRPLSGADLAAIAASAPPRLDSKWTLALAKARAATPAATPQDRLDLAWEAWNRGRIDEARGYLTPYLKARPNDRSALLLMAEVERKQGGEEASRGWLNRALALSAPASLERAQILERLGRPAEAMPIVQALHVASPDNRRLTAYYGRLLIATGDPGKARKVLQP